MNQISRAAAAMASLSVFRGILSQPVPKAFYRLLCTAEKGGQEFFLAWGEFVSALCEEGSCGSFARCLTETLLYDENAFSLAAANGETSFSPELLAAAKRDVETIHELSALTPNDILAASPCAAEAASLHLPEWNTGKPIPELDGNPKEFLNNLACYYRKNGCGIYSRYHAFIWRNGQTTPVSHPDKIRLSDLKGYELQRRLAIENTEAFVKGYPANNCLLYGDRGTGKSSTVKALLNEYYPMGLRMIEMPKESLSEFPILADKLAALPVKFIIFIDDLSFNREDDTYASLKAVLEGGLAARPDNVLIYATSNRRHLVRETFSDREGDEIHRGDSIQESLSLYDRFGLAINFVIPGKEEYLSIVRRLAEQRGLKIDTSELEDGAEKWAIARGGRSPRCAKQYIRSVEARLKQNSSPCVDVKGDSDV
ncbi:ATP-binding protein [Thermocaproicibacter melissae]|uniref:ATP-binding protein n=1 Tax=Thermocaproicibacter melissae TaxID=2966552 RepID=UPI0024B171BD|nr:ATP-binding protein [Thermocaproicibacter melissae]WBY64069.1 ATP-binding protein [Thermocaproicibacter melissae]